MQGEKKSILKSFLTYSKSQKIGVILLFAIIILLQGFYFFYNFQSPKTNEKVKQNWLANQSSIDSLKLMDSKTKGLKQTTI